MYNFNEKFRILHFFKFNIWGVISAKVRFINYYKFTLCNKPIPQKPNTCIERKVYYAGVFCKISHSERLIGGPEGKLLLDFARAGSKNGEVMPRKILRSPFENSALCCFLTAFNSPHIMRKQKQKRHTCVCLFYFWWTRGELNPCPKTS